MSADKRREIAERYRLAIEHSSRADLLNQCDHCRVDAAMREYAALVLEEAAIDLNIIAERPIPTDRAIGYEQAAQRLLARAAEERKG